jgi:hypothetical protein
LLAQTGVAIAAPAANSAAMVKVLKLDITGIHFCF